MVRKAPTVAGVRKWWQREIELVRQSCAREIAGRDTELSMLRAEVARLRPVGELYCFAEEELDRALAEIARLKGIVNA